VRLLLSDTGEGIAPADLPFIFDRFWRADQARTQSSSAGSGLGLAIARQLIQAHGGTIQVESAPGQGTEFIIELPAAPG
jgi:signal transduction histidine kinase